jgi:hypothetical protein
MAQTSADGLPPRCRVEEADPDSDEATVQDGELVDGSTE